MKKALFLPFLAILFITQSVSAQYNLTLNFEKMNPHVGQRFEVRVVNMADSTEVGRQVIKEITTDSFTIELFVLLANSSYNVDFYADLNGNGEYDAPPVDHAWRRTVDVAAQDVVMDFAHVTIFTDIAFPDAYDFSFYEATWGGKWMNLTFGSTDTIRSHVQIACDSFHISGITSGLFGNPDTVEFEFKDAVPSNFDPACDTMTVELTTPLTGTLTLINGMMTGDFAVAGTGLGLKFTGNYGAGQQLFQYQVLNNGLQFANGFSYLRELEVIAQVPALELSVIEIGDVTCAASSNGFVVLDAQGGVTPITFDWSDGGSGISRTDLAGGEYTITATDANGCTDTILVTLTEPEILVLSIVDMTPVACFGDDNGALEVIAEGGCPPYFYSIDGSVFGLNNVFTDLPAGIYNVVVQDAKGCSSDTQVEVVQAEEIHPTIAAVDETSVGAEDGMASTAPSGGTPPYSVLWSTGETTDTITGLSPGIYSITVTDSVGCTVTDSIVVSPFECSLIVEIEGIGVICPGDKVVLVATASSAPVSYLWSNGSTAQSVEVMAGTYHITVTDEFGCTATGTFVVSEFSEIIVDTIIVTHEEGGNSDGTIEVAISGGQPPYVYAWTKDGSFFSDQKDLAFLSAGLYCLQITDSNGCTTKTDTITLENTTSVIDLSRHLQIYPNPASTFIYIKSDITWSKRMVDMHGREVELLNTGIDEKVSVAGLIPGVYFLIFSQEGSVISKKVVVQR